MYLYSIWPILRPLLNNVPVGGWWRVLQEIHVSCAHVQCQHWLVQTWQRYHVFLDACLITGHPSGRNGLDVRGEALAHAAPHQAIQVELRVLLADADHLAADTLFHAVRPAGNRV